MTISITVSQCSFEGDGSSVTFPIADGSNGIYFTSSDEIAVTVDGATVSPSAYAVSGAGTDSGSITFTSAPADGTAGIIKRNTVITQGLSLTRGGYLSPTSVMESIDKLTRIDQDQQRQLGGHETRLTTAEGDIATILSDAAAAAEAAIEDEVEAAAASAAAAAASATTAAGHVASAQTALAATEAASAAALSAFDSFDDRYLGAFAVAPTLDHDGNALVAGALYFDTVVEAMMVWTGTSWAAAYVQADGTLAQWAGIAPASKADTTALTAEASARADADTALQTAVDGKADTTALTALQTAVDGKADASAIAAVAGACSALSISTTGSSATITITAAEIVVKDAIHTYKSLRAVSLSVSGATSGAGGLDAGALAGSTWYAVHVIANADGTAAGLLSLSATAPTLPSGYTYSARVGWIKTDASANKFPLAFKQLGRLAQWVIAASTNLTALPCIASGNVGSWSGNVPNWATVSLAGDVPSTAMTVRLVAKCPGGAGSVVQVAPSPAYGGLNDATIPSPVINYPYAGGAGTGMTIVAEWLLESMNVYVVSQAAYVFVLGWEDNTL